MKTKVKVKAKKKSPPTSTAEAAKQLNLALGFTNEGEISSALRCINSAGVILKKVAAQFKVDAKRSKVKSGKK